MKNRIFLLLSVFLINLTISCSAYNVKIERLVGARLGIESSDIHYKLRGSEEFKPIDFFDRNFRNIELLTFKINKDPFKSTLLYTVLTTDLYIRPLPYSPNIRPLPYSPSEIRSRGLRWIVKYPSDKKVHGKKIKLIISMSLFKETVTGQVQEASTPQDLKVEYSKTGLSNEWTTIERAAGDISPLTIEFDSGDIVWVRVITNNYAHAVNILGITKKTSLSIIASEKTCLFTLFPSLF